MNIIETLKKKLKDIQSSLSDNQGWVRQGRLTLEPIREVISNWAAQPQNFRKVQALQTWEPLFNPIETAKRSLASQNISTLKQFVSKLMATAPQDFERYVKNVSQRAYSPFIGKTASDVIGTTVGSYGKQILKGPSTIFQNKPLPEKVGDILSTIGAVVMPGEVLSMTAFSPIFKVGEKILTNKRLPTKKELVGSISEGIEFGSKLAPISFTTGELLKPIFSKLNPAGQQSLATYINLAKNPNISQEAKNKLWGMVWKTAGKQLTEAFSKGSIGMGTYGAMLPAKNTEERIKNIIEQGITGGIFEAGAKGIGQAFQVAEGLRPKIKLGSQKAFARLPIEGEQKDIKKLVARAVKEGKITTEEGQAILGELREKPTVKIKPKTSPPLFPTEDLGGGGVVGKEVKEIIGKPQITGGEGGIKPPQPPPLSDEDLIARLTKAIKEAKPLRETQEALYEKARGEKLAKLLKIREKMAGEKGFYEELGALKGELPKVQFETIRQEFNQENVDRLFNMIKENKSLDPWEKVNAQVGLQKILGEKGLGVPTKSELEKLYKVYGKEFTETLLSKRPFFEKLQEAGMQLYNLPRSLMAGVGDLSATFMQNVLFAYRHPITTAKNFIEQLKMFASEPYYKQSMEEIANRPTYELMKKAKVNLTDVSPVMSAREEQFMSSWVEKIPGLGRLVKSTGRAWTGFLNKMRADVFDQIVNSAKEVGKDINDPLFLKSLGEFVNAGTGRGSLGQLERVAPILSQGLFSARKLAALGQTLNPVWYIKADPFVRKEALKTMLAFLGGGATILGLAKLAGAEVGDDPTSTDFGKIKIGNTRFNVFGTYQQVAVLFARLFKGYATSSTTGKRMILGDETAWRPLNRFDLITRFFESKEHPTLSLIIGALRGQTNLGQPFEPAPEILRRFIPMVLADSYDLYKEHGAKGLLGVIPLILGIPTQTYGREYAVQETTPTGKPKLKLKPETDLAEDIILKLTGKPKTNIPDQQYIVPQLQKERQEKIEYEQLKRDLMEGKIPTGEISQDFKTQKLLFEYSPEKQKIIGDILLYKDENDKVKEISLDFKIDPPKLTGNTELDKKIISKYKSKITQKTNDILKLYELGVINDKEAELLLNQLKYQVDKVNTKVGRGKKIKIGSAVKLKSVKIAMPKARRIKIAFPKTEVKAPDVFKTTKKKVKIKSKASQLAKKIASLV